MKPSDPSSWTTSLVLRNGEAITLRLLRADDRDREIAFLNSLSERTRYLRLLTPLRYLSRHLVDQLMDVDGDQRVAFVATRATPAGEEFVGVARYGIADDPQRAEIAVTVTDAWHRTGVAIALLRRLIDYAQAAGLRGLMGLVLPDNHAMLALARKAGFTAHFSPREHLMHIELEFAGQP